MSHHRVFRTARSASRPPLSLPSITVLLMILSSPALAMDPGELVAPTGPPPPIYGDADRLIVSYPLDGSILTEPPSQVTVYLRKEEFDLEPSSLELWIDGVEYTEALEFYLDRAWLSETQEIFSEEGSHSILARARDTSGAYHESDIGFEWLPLPCLQGCPWPFAPTDEPSVVANLMENFQSFAGSKYWHHGLDIRVPAGTPIRSITSGTVVKVVNYQSGDEYWEVAIQDLSGYVWQYHHVEPTSITVSEGGTVVAGDVIGEVVTWPWTMNGYKYHHLHLNLVRWVGGGSVPGPYGDGFRYYNPLSFLEKGSYLESIDPWIAAVWYAPNEGLTAPPGVSGNSPTLQTIQGDIDVIAKIQDFRTLIPPANGQLYHMGPYELEYEIYPLNPHCGVGYVPRTQLARFDQVPGGATNAGQEDMLKTIFKYGFNAGLVYLSTEFDYSDQRLYYTITNTHNGVPDGPNGYWDTDKSLGVFGGAFPDGEYRFVIYTKDIDGNQDVQEFPVRLQNGLDFNGLCPPFFVDGPKWEDPIDIVSQAGDVVPFTPPALPLAFATMSEGRSRATVDHTAWPVWTFELPSSGVMVAIGLLNGQTATADYYPAMGDLIIEANAEVQLLAIGSGAQFDPNARSTQPLSLRISTRLARDSATGEALIGTPLSIERSLRLVLSETFDVYGETFTMRTQDASGAAATFGLAPNPIPALERRGSTLLALILLTLGAGLANAIARSPSIAPHTDRN